MKSDRRLDALLREFMARGEASRMDEIVRLTRRRLLAAARKIGSAQDAEDAAQAAYYSLLRRCRGSLDAPVFAWLLTAVVRIAYRQKAVARKLTHLAVQLDRPSTETDPPAGAARVEEAALLRAAVGRLPAKYRDVVVLHHLQGLPVPDVAALLEVPRSTVTTRLQRSRALLHTSLSPRFKHGLVFFPWLLMDLVKGKGAALATSVGGIMNAKAVAVVVTAAVAAGTLGFGMGHLSQSPAPRRAPVGSEAAADLRRQFVSSQAEVRRLREQLAAGPQARAENPQPARETRAAEPVRTVLSVHERVRAAARELEVPHSALAAAMVAHELLNDSDARAQDALKELKRHGTDGFRALIALIRGGISSVYFETLFKATPTEGGQVLLLDTLRNHDLGEVSEGAAIIGLAFTDTPEVRDYLVQRIATEQNPATFFRIARVLAQFGEPRGASAFEDKVLPKDPGDAPRWQGLRLGILLQLGGMGGEEAKRILLRYLDDDGTRSLAQIGGALGALRRIDGVAATAAARSIYTSARAELLEEEVLDALRSQGGIED